MKKCISLIIAVCLVLSISSVTLAAENINEHAPDINDPSRVEAIEQLKQRVEAAGYGKYAFTGGTSSRASYPIIETQTLNVPLHQQAETYYCGPACGKMVIDYLQPQNLTQGAVARKMETDSDGTIVYKLTNGLNYYLSGDPYSYVSTSEIAFASGLVYSIDNGYPVVCHVQTNELPIYEGYTSGHYVVATGYYIAQYNQNSASDVRTVYYNDPNYRYAFYGCKSCPINDMRLAINSQSGFYIMGE